MMEVLISGQAGALILLQGEGMSLLRSDLPGVEIPTVPERLPYILGGASDVTRIRVDSKERALEQMHLAEQCDIGLQLTLILFDAKEEPETRSLAAESLADLLAVSAIRDFITNRLYSAPMPAEADLPGARENAGSSAIVIDLIDVVERQQARIDTIRKSWNHLTQGRFGGEIPKHRFLSKLIDAGAFRKLVEAESDSNIYSSAKLISYEAVQEFPDCRPILDEWLVSHKPSRQGRNVSQSVNVSKADGKRQSYEEAKAERVARKVKKGIGKTEKKAIGVAHIERVKQLLKRLDSERRNPEPVLRAIEREMEYLHEFQGHDAKDLPYYAQTLTQLATELSTRGMLAYSLACIRKAHESAPCDPYPISVEISIHAQRNDMISAEEVFRATLAAGMANEVIYSALLNAYGKAGNLVKAEEVFDQAQKAGFAGVFTYAALLDAYGKAGNQQKAEEVFAMAQEAKLADEVTYNALLDAYGKAGNLPKAEELFSQAKTARLADKFTYSTLLDIYSKAGNLAKAEEVFALAQKAGQANEVTYNALLDAYGKAGNLAKAEEVFALAQKAGLADKVTYTALLDAYGKAGNLAKAEEVFYTIRSTMLADRVTYGTMMDAYVRASSVNGAILLFQECLRSDVGTSLTSLNKEIFGNILLKGLYAADRQDELFELLPPDFVSQELLLYFARLHKHPQNALEILQKYGETGSAAQLVCKCRMALFLSERAPEKSVVKLGQQIETCLYNPSKLSTFSGVALTDLLSQCHRATENWEKMYKVWEHIPSDTLDRDSRMAFLAGHGRDSITWGLVNHKSPELNRLLVAGGSLELFAALSLSQTSGLKTPGSAAVYGDVIAGMSNVRGGLDILLASERHNLLTSLHSRTSISMWEQPLELVTQFPLDSLAEVRSGQKSLIEMLQMAA